MGMKAEKPDKPKKTPAPVTPEDEEVTASGKRELERLQQKRGRASTLFSNPYQNTWGKKTGDV